MSKERPNLELRLHQKITVYATYVCRSTQKRTMNFIRENTILLKNISLSKGEILADHVWVSIKDIRDNIKGIPWGARLHFTGTVYAYYKESKKQVLSAKYSIRDINIIDVDGKPFLPIS